MTFLPQTREPRRSRPSTCAAAPRSSCVGFVKKACVADSLGGLVDLFFTAPHQYDGVSAWAALVCYAAQIYCDFSGYTDMAIAVARLLGYELCPNFDFPYLTGSVAEYWRRWHISLSTWLRDYLFIPLGGSRGGELFIARNLMLTMLLGGLWHGAGWNYVFWGGMHGLALVVQRVWERRAPALGHAAMRWLGVPLTFAFVAFAFVPFRVSDVYVDAATSKPLRALADGFYRETGDRLRFPKRSLEREHASGDWRERGGAGEIRVRREISSFAATGRIWEAMLVPGAGGPRRLFRPPLLAVLGLLGLMHWLGWRRWLASWWRAIPAWSYAALLGAGVAFALFLKPVAYRAFIYFQF